MILLTITLVIVSHGNTNVLQIAVAVLFTGFGLFSLHERSYVAGQIAKAGGISAFLAQEVSSEMWSTYLSFADLTGIHDEFDAWCTQQAAPLTISITEQGLSDTLAAVYGVEQEAKNTAYGIKDVLTGWGSRQITLTLTSVALFLMAVLSLTNMLYFPGPDLLSDLLTGLILLLISGLGYWLTRYREKRASEQMLASPVTTVNMDELMCVAIAADIHDAFCSYLRTVSKPVTFQTASDWLIMKQKQNMSVN